MRPRLLQALVDRSLAPPEDASPEACARILRVGSPGLRIRALRRVAALDPRPEALRPLLADPVPGVRRTAAWGLGRTRSPASQGDLVHALGAERVDHVRLAMAVAAIRCGLPATEAWTLLARAARRRVATCYGLRVAAEASGAGIDTVRRELVRALDPALPADLDPGTARPRDPDAVRAELAERLDRDPEDGQALLALAAQQHPGDHTRIVGRKWTSGRRESHLICEALGQHGDPRAIPTLVRVLQAMDVDPGHGFAGRRAAATALGRIGDPSVGRVLVRAMTDEALDHEGRPGAGLGIQFPVRTVMLTALGEAGCRDQATLLAGYLGNTHGSAMGGFYLPAMDALWKLDDPAPLLPLRQGPEIVAAHALGVLGAMGRAELVRPFVGDGRPLVAGAARAALGEAADASG